MMVAKDTLEIKAVKKIIFRKIGIVYLLIDVVLLLIGFSASAMDFYG